MLGAASGRKFTRDTVYSGAAPLPPHAPAAVVAAGENGAARTSATGPAGTMLFPLASGDPYLSESGTLMSTEATWTRVTPPSGGVVITPDSGYSPQDRTIDRAITPARPVLKTLKRDETAV